jgi:hypothetical protein
MVEKFAGVGEIMMRNDHQLSRLSEPMNGLGKSR